MKFKYSVDKYGHVTPESRFIDVELTFHDGSFLIVQLETTEFLFASDFYRQMLCTLASAHLDTIKDPE